jgi:hypothetical protein
MAGGDHAQEAAGTPDPVERGFATLNTLKYVKYEYTAPNSMRC